MRCYYHQDREAVGICKSCNRGLCADCAAEIGAGLACRDRCEAEVAQLNSLLEKAPASYRTTRGVYLRSAWLFFIWGGATLILGLFLLRFATAPGVGYGSVVLGSFLLLFSLSYFRTAHKYGEITK